MTLKYTIKTLEEVPEAIRSLYVEDKEVGFRLAVDGIDDPAELRRAKTRETEARKEAERKLAEIQRASDEAKAAAAAAAEEAAKKAGDIATLEKSWQAKLDAAVAEATGKYQPQVDSLLGDVNRLLIDNVAHGIASQIAVQGSADVLLPHIKSRLRTDVRDGQRVTVVVDPEGKPSASTIADLAKEISGNKAFAPIIAGSKGSGGGANGGHGGGAADSKTITRAQYESLGPTERAAHFKGGGTVVDSPPPSG